MQYIFKRILFSTLFLTVQLGCPGSEQSKKQRSLKLNVSAPSLVSSGGNPTTPSSQEITENQIEEEIKDKDLEKPEELKEEKPESDEKSVDQDPPEESEEIAVNEEEIEGKEGLDNQKEEEKKTESIPTPSAEKGEIDRKVSIQDNSGNVSGSSAESSTTEPGNSLIESKKNGYKSTLSFLNDTCADIAKELLNLLSNEDLSAEKLTQYRDKISNFRPDDSDKKGKTLKKHADDAIGVINLRLKDFQEDLPNCIKSYENAIAGLVTKKDLQNFDFKNKVAHLCEEIYELACCKNNKACLNKDQHTSLKSTIKQLHHYIKQINKKQKK